jgi:guanylate kinase
MSSERSLLFIISAPSGTGKTTLAERLAQVTHNLCLSRSYTSRASRDGEHDGVDYNFITRARFEHMIDADEFLEYADVFGNLYGTSRRDTLTALDSGKDVVLVIDVQGARQVRTSGLEHVGIFVLPPSFDVLQTRLRLRSKDSEAQIQRRLEMARREVGAVEEYDYVVVNDDLEPAVARLQAIVQAERSRLRAMRRTAEGIVRTFENPAHVQLPAPNARGS